MKIRLPIKAYVDLTQFIILFNISLTLNKQKVILGAKESFFCSFFLKPFILANVQICIFIACRVFLSMSSLVVGNYLLFQTFFFCRLHFQLQSLFQTHHHFYYHFHTHCYSALHLKSCNDPLFLWIFVCICRSRGEFGQNTVLLYLYNIINLIFFFINLKILIHTSLSNP